jgi:hypothetical protein
MLSASDSDVPASTWDLLRTVADDGMCSIDKRLEQYGPLDPERFNLKDANQRLAKLAETREVPRMKFRVEVTCLGEDGTEDRCEIVEMERQELAIETLGLNLAEAKAILSNLQDFMTARQVTEDLDKRRIARLAASGITAKAAGRPRCIRCSDPSTLQTRAGTGAPVGRPNRRRSDPRLCGSRAASARTCSTWKPGGLR